jgi:hypothetical protein
MESPSKFHLNSSMN